MKLLGKKGLMKVVDKHELRRLMAEEGAQVVDVLPAEDYAMEHIDGAINIPLTELTPSNVRRLDRARPVVTYCNDFL